jgi:hypothetical protein
MSFTTTLEQIKATLPSASRAYLAGRDRHAALASYATPRDLLAALGRESRLTLDERDLVLLAVLAELRATKDAVWGSVLIVAFERLLSSIRSRLGRPKDEDVDHDLLGCFLQTARDPAITSYAARCIRLGVWRAMITERRAEETDVELVAFEDDTHCTDVFEIESERNAAAAEVLAAIEEEGGAELRDVLLATYADGASVAEYVAHAYPHLSRAQRARKSDELRRLRQRVIDTIRGRVARREIACRVGAA